jgi:hypothetical protein
VAQGVPSRLRPRNSLMFGTTRVVGRQPYAQAAFTPGEIPAPHFQRLSRPQGTWFRRQPRKKSPVTPPGIDPGTSRLAAQCFNRYATPDPSECNSYPKIFCEIFQAFSETNKFVLKKTGFSALSLLVHGTVKTKWRAYFMCCVVFQRVCLCVRGFE